MLLAAMWAMKPKPAKPKTNKEKIKVRDIENIIIPTENIVAKIGIRRPNPTIVLREARYIVAAIAPVPAEAIRNPYVPGPP